ncbi:MAG: hypothetical protein K2X82_09420 [Gemmataceae bacterium]|nr:hypothetical protein [Gemmataceae bacterium]
MTLEERLTRIEALLLGLTHRQESRQWYSVGEFARLVGRSEFTCREWCRLGRVAAQKKASGRGAHASWAISHEEYERFQREGLRPRARRNESDDDT